MRASSTTVAYCPELAESGTHRANDISVACNHYLAHASIWANRFAGCILPNMKTIGLLLIVAVVALGADVGGVGNAKAQTSGGAMGTVPGSRASADDLWQRAVVLIDRNDYRDARSEEHTSELQSPCNLVCRLLLEKKQPSCGWIKRLHHNAVIAQFRAVHESSAPPDDRLARGV